MGSKPHGESGVRGPSAPARLYSSSPAAAGHFPPPIPSAAKVDHCLRARIRAPSASAGMRGPLAGASGLYGGLLRHDDLGPAQHELRLLAGVAPLDLLGDAQRPHPLDPAAADALVQLGVVG